MNERPADLGEWRRAVHGGNAFVCLNDGGRVLIGMESDLTVLCRELSAMLGESSEAHRWPNLFGYLYGGAPADEPMTRARARRIGHEAADLLPLTFGELAARSKVVLERLAALGSV